ncbi:MAG: isoprenylcysteine carboxylmethyltransferase family protein [Chloroflexi bacterium]|nr:isoprenylcysteine carboxylmethyltransferase family protein [Chloroflexota bacterium]
MYHKFQQWAQKEYRPFHQTLTVAISGAVFGFGVPLLLVVISAWLDDLFHFPRLIFGMWNTSVGLLMVFVGWVLAAWSVQVQFVEGKGTPVPIVPTKNLVQRGPYQYCRNPMALGVILFYFGVAVWLGSVSVLLAVIVISIILLLYFRFIEEKELEIRFGQPYLDYKRNTPFIIPRFRKQGRDTATSVPD